MVRCAQALLLAGLLVACATGGSTHTEVSPVVEAAPGSEWMVPRNVVPRDPADADRFGVGVAVHEDRLLVGASGTQRAHLYAWKGTQLEEVEELVRDATDRAADAFGASVALGPDLAIMGSPDERTAAGDNLGGRVLVFGPDDAGHWKQIQELASPSPNTAFGFGSVLALGGDVLAIGSIGTGVQLYGRTNGTFAVGERIAAPAGATGFGVSVAMSGGLLAVGAPSSAAVHLYTTSSGVAVAGPKLAGDAGSGFGTHLCFAKGTLVVGAVASTPTGNVGAIHTFDSGPEGWHETANIAATAGSLACAADRIAVGVDGGTLVLARSGATWTKEVTFEDSQDHFGQSLGMFGSALVAGISQPSDDVDHEPPGFVEVYRFAKQNAVACAAGSECESGECADGVCCDRACGTDANDCQACSVAAGAPVDGICAPLAATTVCREAKGGCDVADHCDGASSTCPADDVAPNGAACKGGTCGAGVCVAPSGVPVVETKPGPDVPTATPATAPPSGCAAGTSSRGDGAAFAMLLLAALRRRRRADRDG